MKVKAETHRVYVSLSNIIPHIAQIIYSRYQKHLPQSRFSSYYSPSWDNFQWEETKSAANCTSQASKTTKVFLIYVVIYIHIPG